MLTYPPFSKVQKLALIGKGGAAVKKGSAGAAVALVQGALVDLGAKMPTSTAGGSADGIFGFETQQAVKDFQSKNGLKPDGIVGKKTLVALDQQMKAHAVPKAPKKAVPPPATARDPHYMLGTQDPQLAPDAGSGPWGSKPKSAAYTALKAEIASILPHAYVIIGDDAVKHMARYLANTGAPLTLDLEGMLQDVESARNALLAEATQAQTFAETLPPGRHAVTSRTAEGGYNYKEESWNWFYATGGYVSWGKGTVVVKAGTAGREYDLDFEYKLYDRYNWDGGKEVTILGITVTDEFMAEFHRQGLAREFDCFGSVRRKLTWKHGTALSNAQLRQPATGQR